MVLILERYLVGAVDAAPVGVMGTCHEISLFSVPLLSSVRKAQTGGAGRTFVIEVPLFSKAQTGAGRTYVIEDRGSGSRARYDHRAVGFAIRAGRIISGP
jgi:hypothetical protein